MNILSQDEIDQLLSAISQEPSTQENWDLSYGREKKVRIYDFKRPPFLTKTHITVLNTVLKKYANDLTKSLTEQFGLNINVYHNYTSQYTFEEFRRCIPKTTYLTIIDMVPLDGYAVVHIGKEAYVKFLNLAKANSSINQYSNKNISKLESALVIMNTGVLRYAFSEIIDLRPRVVKTISDSYLLNFLENDTMCVNADFDIVFQLDDNQIIESQINICIPKPTLSKIKHKLNITHLQKTKELTFDLDNISIPVHVRFEDKASLDLIDIEDISPGLFIKLNKKDLEICF